MAPMPRPEVLRGDDRGLLDGRRHAGEELALDLEVLDHGLEDPVGVLQLLPVVLEVAGADERRRARAGAAGWASACARLVERRVGQRAAVGGARAGTMSSSATSRPWATRWAATCAPMVPGAQHDGLLMPGAGSCDHRRPADPRRLTRRPSYMRSIRSLYFCSTTRRFTLRVGVSSPASRLNSRGEQRDLLDLLELGQVAA